MDHFDSEGISSLVGSKWKPTKTPMIPHDVPIRASAVLSSRIRKKRGKRKPIPFPSAYQSAAVCATPPPPRPKKTHKFRRPSHQRHWCELEKCSSQQLWSPTPSTNMHKHSFLKRTGKGLKYLKVFLFSMFFQRVFFPRHLARLQPHIWLQLVVHIVVCLG